MGDVFNAIILGIIEGLTEFLPVSSTGHMILAQPLLGVDENDPKWSVFLFVVQFGAIAAVVLYFWRDLRKHVLTRPHGPLANHLAVKLAVALAPSIVFGLAFNNFMEAHLEKGWMAPYAVAGGLIVGAAVMFLIDRYFRRSLRMSIENVTIRQALFIGLAQCLAMWPGTSRSMVTIMAGMLVGLPPTVAARFSFFLAIPTMVLAPAYRLFKHRDELNTDALAIILIGSVTAFIVALAVIAAFMTYIRTRRFTPFAIYRVILGVAVLWAAWAAH